MSHSQCFFGGLSIAMTLLAKFGSLVLLLASTTWVAPAWAENEAQSETNLQQLFEGTQEALNALIAVPSPDPEASFPTTFEQLNESARQKAAQDAQANQDDSGTTQQSAPGTAGGAVGIKDASLGGENLGAQIVLQFPPTVTQSAVNLANIIKSDTEIRDATQVMSGSQTAGASFMGYDILLSGGLAQTSENFGNVIIAKEVEMVAQHMSDGTSQIVENSAEISGAASGISQVGRNTGNYVLADLSIGSGEQVLPEGVEQRVSNTADLRYGALVPEVHQFGINIGNTMQADHVEDVVRIFNGSQIVDNVMILNPDMPLPTRASQTGMNIANLVVANTVSNLQQVSNGTQQVNNRVFSPSLEELTGASSIVQASSENYVNVLIVSGDFQQLENTEGLQIDGNGNISARQSANYQQTVTARGGHSQVGNAASITQ